MKQISAIFCPPPGPNPGMSSVEVALRAVTRRLGVDVDVRYLYLYHPSELHRELPADAARQMHESQRLPFEFECYRDRLDELYASDAILFWGDFLHARDFHDDMANYMVKSRISADKPQALETISRHLLLTEAPVDVLNRCISFGGTMIFNRQREYLEEPYTSQLSRYIRNARGIWMRDVYSALRVSQIREDYASSHLGVDCSMLLRDEDLVDLATSDWSHDAGEVSQRAAVFFGRSSTPPKQLARFARDLCAKIGRQADWLPWGDASAFEERGKLIHRHFRQMAMPDRQGRPLVGDLFRMLSSYAVVISDTYHVCVNAWRLGVPAICVADTIFKGRMNVNSGHSYAWRDKRQTFYSMYDANEFFVFDAELEDRTWRQRRIYQLWESLPNRQLIAGITGNIRHHRDACEESLRRELRSMLLESNQRSALAMACGGDLGSGG